MSAAPEEGTSMSNRGHGHVIPRPDGAKARCGGPALCQECARELAQVPGEIPPAEVQDELAATRDEAGRAVLVRLLAALGKPPGFGESASTEHLLHQVTEAYRGLRASEKRAWDTLAMVRGIARDLERTADLTGYDPDMATLRRHIASGIRFTAGDGPEGPPAAGLIRWSEVSPGDRVLIGGELVTVREIQALYEQQDDGTPRSVIRVKYGHWPGPGGGETVQRGHLLTAVCRKGGAEADLAALRRELAAAATVLQDPAYPPDGPAGALRDALRPHLAAIAGLVEEDGRG